MAARAFLIDGNRRGAAFVEDAETFSPDNADAKLALAYGVGEPKNGWISLGASPFLERPLVLRGLPLFLPVGGKPGRGFREIFVDEPRIGRLWGRFSIDVAVALERSSKLFAETVFAPIAGAAGIANTPGSAHAASDVSAASGASGGYRVFIVEDGERYAIRGMCVFRVEGDVGTVVEVLHDRSVTGMRAASHVLGLAIRAMQKDGARVARAAALPHSGTVPIFLRHAFRRVSGPPLIVRPLDSAVEDLVTYPEGWYVSALDFVATPTA